jgi:uncharacterized protein YjbI with pentapeptide repeats
MVNSEHLHRLLQGSEVWNIWRDEHPDAHIDLHRARLSGLDFSNANLSGASLTYAQLTNAHLKGADLRNANLTGVNLADANLNGADLREASLCRAYLNDATLISANLKNTDMSSANLSEADLRNAHLNGADCSGVDLRGANLTDSDVSETNFHGAYLSRAYFNGARFKGTILTSASIGWASLGDCDLRSIVGLETVHHTGPSPISINTLYLSEGNIPEAFLRGAGLPDGFIEYIQALVQRPIEYYTCFISYSSRDELFAKRLHNDLQQEEVRCWFAPEDMNIGDKIRSRIDTSIKMYDKLLLILSDSSLASKWVAYEVRQALKKEPPNVPNVLYPLRLDRSILSCDTTWAKDIRKTRYIGDFEAWTDPQKYDASFKRLLRALKGKPEQTKK